jgi:hypothetical protein
LEKFGTMGLPKSWEFSPKKQLSEVNENAPLAAPESE